MTQRQLLSRLAPAALAALALLATGCPSGSPPPAVGDGQPATSSETPVSPAAGGYDLEIPMVDYVLDPSAGDPSVPAGLGGPGFTGEGWETNLRYPQLGSAEAVPGGRMVRMLADWPATFRQTGKDWNTSFNYMVNDLCYESLVGVHPTTLEYVPGLASHWWIAEDKMSYRFRIDPRARWSDGSEVTAEDVVASFNLRMDPTTLDPSSQLTFGKMEAPTALSKYIVEVMVKEENWRNFLYFGGMAIFPAKEVSIPGSEYLDKYQFAYTANTGPYVVDMDSIVTGQEVTVRRRDDYWNDDNPANVGLHNIGAFKFVVVKDWNLAFEKAKKGELDYFPIPKAQWWAEELDKVDAVQRGLLLKAKFYTDAPIGTSGLAVNMKRAPLDDRRMRLALQKLMDRETMIRQLFFDEYEPLTSYFQGGTYQNPGNELHAYDPFGAVELLEEMGWTKADPNAQYRTKDGRELTFKLTYRSPLSERSLTVFQEECRDAGIRLELQLLTPAAHWKAVRQKDYEIASMAWGGLTFPNPETTWHSSLADVPDNNNITAFADPRVDELCKEYDQEYDIQRRIEIIREIDGILYEAVPYVLEWYNPAQRVVAWNKFSWPEWGSLRTGDQEDSLYYTWWVDPDKAAALEAARQDPEATLPKPPVDNTFWQEWNAARRAGAVD